MSSDYIKQVALEDNNHMSAIWLQKRQRPHIMSTIFIIIKLSTPAYHQSIYRPNKCSLNRRTKMFYTLKEINIETIKTSAFSTLASVEGGSSYT